MATELQLKIGGTWQRDLQGCMSRCRGVACNGSDMECGSLEEANPRSFRCAKCATMHYALASTMRAEDGSTICDTFYALTSTRHQGGRAMPVESHWEPQLLLGTGTAADGPVADLLNLFS